VPEYRVFSLDRQGRILEGFNAICADDKEACELLEQSPSVGTRAEIWSSTRFVAKVVMPVQPATVVPPPPGSQG